MTYKKLGKRRKAKPKRKRRTKRKAPKRKRQTSTALVPVAPAPMVRREPSLRPEQVALLKRTVAKGTSDDEFALFLLVARKHKLDPFTRQLHCVMRFDKALGRDKMVIQIGIDGYRAMAARSHRDYGSISEPEFEYKEGGRKENIYGKNLLLARVKCWKKGLAEPTVAVAFWDEYAPDTNSKQSFFWKQMPHGQLGKCAEALGLRKAWPDLSDIYTNEEMAQADIDLSPEGREVTDLEGRPLSAPALPPAPALEPPATPSLPTDPKAGALAKINRYKEMKWRKGVYATVQYGNHDCTCLKKDLWPYLEAGVGELAVLALQRSGNYLNIVGISSIGNQTFSEVEGKSVLDVQLMDGSRAKGGAPPPPLAHAVARPATRNSKKILITYKGDFAEVSGDTVALRERMVDGMAGKRDEERKLYVIPAAWVPTLQAVCDDEGIEVEEKDTAMA
jgi:phage recombination protein Bet